MTVLEAATATAQSALLAFAVFAAGVVVGWLALSARQAVQKARHARTLFTDEEFEVLYRSLHPDLPYGPVASKLLQQQRAEQPHVDQWVRDRHLVRGRAVFVQEHTPEGGGSR